MNILKLKQQMNSTKPPFRFPSGEGAEGTNGLEEEEVLPQLSHTALPHLQRIAM